MRYRSIALPPEHGGWGLLFEPIIIGMVAAPSGGGALIALAAIGVFLSRQPLKIVLTDRAAGRRVPRTRHATWFAAGYLAITALAAGAAFLQRGLEPFLPAAFAAPLAIVQLVYDAQNRSRGLLPEVCGATALASSASAVALAAGWTLGPALALWTVAAARTVPAMIAVRTRVLRLHGQPASGTLPLVTHSVGLATVFVLQTMGLVARGVVTLLAILAARAGFTLRASAPRVRAQRIGIEELAIGLLASVLLGWLSRR